MKPTKKLRQNARCTVSIALWLLMLWLPIAAHSQIVLDANDLSGGNGVALKKDSWKYSAGDDQMWAEKDFDDAVWAQVKSNWRNVEDFRALEWNGRGWFRHAILVDENLINQPLALRVWQDGASEIYLDGKLLHSFGAIAADGADQEYNPRGLFVPIVFASAGAHTIAVRYSYSATKDVTVGIGRWLAAGDHAPGFTLEFARVEDAALKLEARAVNQRLDYVLIGLLAALAAIHFLLYAFYKQQPGNLLYSLFVAGIAVTMWLSRFVNTAHATAVSLSLAEIARENLQSITVISLLAFLYVEFVNRISRFVWILTAVWIVGTTLHFLQFARLPQFTPALLVATLAVGLWIVARALTQKRAGAWIIAAGIGAFIFCVLHNIAVGHKLIELPTWFSDFVQNATILCVPVAVSIYLARNFAQTNKNLETQLIKTVEHERNHARLQIVEAENERRAQELEEAKHLQLSMLPKKLPEIANLEIAAYMKPASEVGGDYYDFHLGADETLTVAVGDATGHGLKAGSVVTATKSLFNAFADEPDISRIFEQISQALKRMNLRGLFMALLMLKLKNYKLKIAVAGMPPLLIYRRATRTVEEIAIRALPLGSISNLHYRTVELTVASGDLIVLMSDGFPEMFDSENQILGYERAAQILPEIADFSAQEIINNFVAAGEKWANGRPADDDVTFVVLKIK